jgi:hypothetical protein
MRFVKLYMEIQSCAAYRTSQAQVLRELIVIVISFVIITNIMARWQLLITSFLSR